MSIPSPSSPSGLPLLNTIHDANKFYSDLKTQINNCIYGQNNAIDVVLQTFKRYLVGLNEPSKPIGSFLFAGPTGSGKCVSENTILFTQYGLVPIGSLVSNLRVNQEQSLELELYTSEGPKKTSRIYNNGIKQTKKIRTRFGYEIEAPFNHPILIIDRDLFFKYVRIDQLNLGDRLPIQRGQQYWGTTIKLPTYVFENKNTQVNMLTKELYAQTIIPTTISRSLSRLLGYYISEGNIDTKGITITNADHHVIQDIVNILLEVFNYKLKVYSYKPSVCSLRINNKKINDFFKSIGVFRGLSKDKFIPECILKAPKEYVVEFLRGYFEGDGTVEGTSVTCTSASKKLIQQLQTVMLNFGIISRVKRVYKAATNGTKIKRPYHTLYIMGENVEIYAKEIGFLSKEKNNRLENILNKARNTNVDTIPYLHEHMRVIYKNNQQQIPFQNSILGKPTIKAIELYSWKGREQQGVTYNKLSQILDLRAEPVSKLMDIAKLEDIYKKHYFYDTIESIEDSECQTYDLTVPGPHNFCGNGFINHNTMTTKVLAEQAFGKEGLIKIDCSEYAQEFMATRLIGAPPGYIGHENGSVLIRMMQQRKDKGTIILFDEIEKAHPTFFDLFLQILDEAILTDGSGVQADFSKTIIIMTSNIGSKNYTNTQSMGFRSSSKVSDIEKTVSKAIKDLLRPELINRLTSILYFKPLSEIEIKLILGKYFKELNKRLQRLEIKLEPSDELMDYLVSIGYSPEYNARELYRTFTKYIINPISDIILSGELKSDSLVMLRLSSQTLGSSPRLLLKRIGSCPLLEDGEEEG